MPQAGFVTRRGFGARLKEVYTEPNTGCWLWSGSVNATGYGLALYQGRQSLAHRVSYEYHKGEIGDLCVLHKCDVPLCVNPDHLFLGTRTENIADMHAKKRRKYSRGASRTPISADYVKRPSKGFKLNHDQVRAIYTDRRTQREIAIDYGVSQYTVWAIQSHRNWRSVTREIETA